MFRLSFFLLLFFCYSCDENKTSNTIESDLINNPNTIDNPEKSKFQGPVFSFVSEEHDFGEVIEGEVVVHMFKFKNTGDKPLIISDAQGSCGCTTPNWSSQPIRPGAEGHIEVKFASQGRVGSNQKTVTITANTIPNKTYLKIDANVKKLEK